MANAKVAVMVDVQRSLGSQLFNASSTMRQQYSRLTELRDQLANMNDGTDFGMIEAAMGLQPGQGSVVWNVVNSAQAQMAADAGIAKYMSYFYSSM